DFELQPVMIERLDVHGELPLQDRQGQLIFVIELLGHDRFGSIEQALQLLRILFRSVVGYIRKLGDRETMPHARQRIVLQLMLPECIGELLYSIGGGALTTANRMQRRIGTSIRSRRV